MRVQYRVRAMQVSDFTPTAGSHLAAHTPEPTLVPRLTLAQDPPEYYASGGTGAHVVVADQGKGAMHSSFELSGSPESEQSGRQGFLSVELEPIEVSVDFRYVTTFWSLSKCTRAMSRVAAPARERQAGLSFCQARSNLGECGLVVCRSTASQPLNARSRGGAGAEPWRLCGIVVCVT